MAEIKQLANVPEVSFTDNMSLEEVREQTKAAYRDRYIAITGKEPELSRADPVNLVLDAIALLYYQWLQYADNIGRQQMLKFSTGAYLDNIAAMWGITRKPAGFASATVRFTRSSTMQSGAIGIPEGTTVRTEAGEFFETAEYAEVPGGESYVDVQCVAVEPGEESNGLEPGVINVLVDVIPYISGVENVSISRGGTDVESDQSLTERVFLAPSAYSCAGPAGAYEFFAKEWRADVKDVKVTNPEPCLVKIFFMLESGAPDQEDCESMERFLMEDANRPMCDKVECSAPTEVQYDISILYTIAKDNSKSATTIQNAITTAVAEYVEWQNTMGRDINPAELISRIRNAGAHRVTLTNPIFEKVEDTEVPKLRTQAVTYGGLEDA